MRVNVRGQYVALSRIEHAIRSSPPPRPHSSKAPSPQTRGAQTYYPPSLKADHSARFRQLYRVLQNKDRQLHLVGILRRTLPHIPNRARLPTARCVPGDRYRGAVSPSAATGLGVQTPAPMPAANQAVWTEKHSDEEPRENAISLRLR